MRENGNEEKEEEQRATFYLGGESESENSEPGEENEEENDEEADPPANEETEIILEGECQMEMTRWNHYTPMVSLIPRTMMREEWQMDFGPGPVEEGEMLLGEYVWTKCEQTWMKLYVCEVPNIVLGSGDLMALTEKWKWSRGCVGRSYFWEYVQEGGSMRREMRIPHLLIEKVHSGEKGREWVEATRTWKAKMRKR